MYIASKCASGQYEEKKSKFIAQLYYVENEDQVADILEKVRKKYYDARHNCYAYIIGKDRKLSKLSDDGEPSGTAGRPIMDVLEGKELTNALMVVTRYFGGVKLGTGGLTRAYSAAAKEAVELSEYQKISEGVYFELSLDYTMGATAENYFRKNDILIEEISYTDKEKIRAVVPAESMDKVRKDFMDMLKTQDIPAFSDIFSYVNLDRKIKEIMRH